MLSVKSFSAVRSSSCPVPQLKETLNSWLKRNTHFWWLTGKLPCLWKRPSSKAQFFTVQFSPPYPRSSWAEVGLWRCCLWKTQPWRQFLKLKHNPVTSGRKKTPEHVAFLIITLYDRLFQIILCFTGFLLGQVLPGARGREGTMSGECWWAAGSWYLLLAMPGIEMMFKMPSKPSFSKQIKWWAQQLRCGSAEDWAQN